MMLFFPALSWPKLVLAPLRNGGRVRIMSPSGASTLITSAPRSARRRVQCGPAIVVVKSSTRRASKAPLIIGFLISGPIRQGQDSARGMSSAPDRVRISGLLLPGFGAKRPAGLFGGRVIDM